MCDVLHYWFEEDNTLNSPEEAESKSALRTSLYQDMYGTSYKYKLKGQQSAMPDFSTLGPPEEMMTEAESVKPFNPKTVPTQPYSPPTPVNANSPLPFGNVLDAPMQH